MGTLPTDPKFARAMRYSGFFRGPWNVGPVGDFLDYYIAFFFGGAEFCDNDQWNSQPSWGLRMVV